MIFPLWRSGDRESRPVDDAAVMSPSSTLWARSAPVSRRFRHGSRSWQVIHHSVGRAYGCLDYRHIHTTRALSNVHEVMAVDAFGVGRRARRSRRHSTSPAIASCAAARGLGHELIGGNVFNLHEVASDLVCKQGVVGSNPISSTKSDLVIGSAPNPCSCDTRPLPTNLLTPAASNGTQTRVGSGSCESGGRR